jgi:hypothetical protein
MPAIDGVQLGLVHLPIQAGAMQDHEPESRVANCKQVRVVISVWEAGSC